MTVLVAACGAATTTEQPNSAQAPAKLKPVGSPLRVQGQTVYSKGRNLVPFDPAGAGK